MNLTCPKCGYSWNYKGKHWRTTCSKCRTNVRTGNKTPWENTSVNTSLKSKHIIKNTSPISSDFMSGSLIDALKKTGLDPMKNGQIRDAISSILETDEYKIAFADAVEKTRLSPIRLTKKILKDWLKKEGYL